MLTCVCLCMYVFNDQLMIYRNYTWCVRVIIVLRRALVCKTIIYGVREGFAVQSRNDYNWVVRGLPPECMWLREALLVKFWSLKNLVNMKSPKTGGTGPGKLIPRGLGSAQHTGQ